MTSIVYEEPWKKGYIYRSAKKGKDTIGNSHKAEEEAVLRWIVFQLNDLNVRQGTVSRRIRGQAAEQYPAIWPDMFIGSQQHAKEGVPCPLGTNIVWAWQ
jgi:hypothetical protein